MEEKIIRKKEQPPRLCARCGVGDHRQKIEQGGGW